MKLLILQFSAVFCYFCLLGPDILSTLFSDTINICSLNVRNKVSHHIKEQVKLWCRVF